MQSTDDEDHSVSSGSDSGSNDDDDDDIQLPHGKSSAAKTNPESAILQVENPNRVAKTVIKASEMGSSSGAGDAPALSRREREAMEAEVNPTKRRVHHHMMSLFS